jgi:PAS domain S-box-containing protein
MRRESKSGGGSRGAASTTTLRILFLEDSPQDATRVRESLAGAGLACEVVSAGSLAQREEAIARGDFDVILADDAHPSFEALFRARRSCPDVPLIVISDAMGEERAIEYVKRGAADCVLKGNLSRLTPVAQRAVADAWMRKQRREQEKCLREFAEHIHGFFWMTDVDGGELLYASAAYEDIWGRPLQSLEACPQERFEAILAEDRGRVEAALAALARGEVYDEEYRIHCPDGSIRWIWDRGRAVPGAQAQFLVGFAQDVTTRKELEAQLSRTQKLESLGRLAGGVAHDLNNQLSVILGAAEMVRETNLDAVAQDDLKMVLVAAEKAAALTDQLLTFSRRQVLRPEVTDLNAVVRGTKAVLGHVLPENVELVLRLDASLSTIRIDPVQLEQVILNLALNARDAMPRGGTLTIETMNVYVDDGPPQPEGPVEPGHHILLAFRDTGVGMDRNTLARVFEPFFTTKESRKGTGLGLAVVHGIVRQSGGHIRAHSQPDQGSTFEVYLPFASGETCTAQPVVPRTADEGTETLLVVEDDELVLDMMIRVLEKRGYRVLATTSAEEAIEIFRQEKHDIQLLITDVVMPRMTGPEVAGQIAAIRRDVRVLYMSGHTDQALEEHGLNEPDSLFLAKPLRTSELLGKIRQALGQEPLRAERAGDA